MSTCPTCDATVTSTPDGTLLNPKKSIVGRHLPDGTQLRPDDLRHGIRGHLIHECPPPGVRGLATVKKRHADIPQDALPGLDDVAIPADATSRPAEPRSTRWAECPKHKLDTSAKHPLTGLYETQPGTWVYRTHNRTIGKVTEPCPGSGLEHPHPERLKLAAT